jgi:UDP-GlcNAc:undecaprenyl-phosphate GlcNAc-1-phosphate transferase
VDRPDDPSLKAHDRPAVPLGGVGVFLGVHLAYLTRGELDLGLLLASSVVLVLGLVDDRRGVDPATRLVVEVAAALILILDVAGNPGILFLLLGGALVVFAINSVNLFDGLDGLVGSVALVTAVGLAIVAEVRGADFVPL